MEAFSTAPEGQNAEKLEVGDCRRPSAGLNSVCNRKSCLDIARNMAEFAVITHTVLKILIEIN